MNHKRTGRGRASTAAGTSSLVLIVGSFVGDESAWDQILGPYRGEEKRVQSGRETLTLLQNSSVRVVICERDLPDGTWRDMLESMAGLNEPPALIVASRLADDHLWLEVLNAGGYDVLARPFDRQEANRTIALAHRLGSHRGPRGIAAERSLPTCLRI